MLTLLLLAAHSIIASCIPTLKHIFEKFLRQVGLLSSRGTSQSRTGYMKHDEDGAHQLRSIRSTTGKHDTSRRTFNKTSRGADDDSDDGPSPSYPSPTYFTTVVESRATRGGGGGSIDDNGSQERIINHGGQGIQMETSISVRTTSKASVDDVPL